MDTKMTGRERAALVGVDVTAARSCPVAMQCAEARGGKELSRTVRPVLNGTRKNAHHKARPASGKTGRRDR
jgi:hypothetical protein